MKKTQVLLSILLLVLAAAVPATAQKRAARVSLDVTIDDTAAQTGGIRSDGLGVYSDGVDGISAGIDEYGWFGFDTGSAGRVVTADYSTPINIVTAGLPATETRRGDFRTFITSLKFQDMVIGSSQCVGAGLAFSYGDRSGTQRSIGYRRGDSDTAWVKVYRQDADTWTLTSQSDCNGPSLDNIARLRERKTKGKTTPELIYGTYLMPFRMTLTRRP